MFAFQIGNFKKWCLRFLFVLFDLKMEFCPKELALWPSGKDVREGEETNNCVDKIKVQRGEKPIWVCLLTMSSVPQSLGLAVNFWTSPIIGLKNKFNMQLVQVH